MESYEVPFFAHIYTYILNVCIYQEKVRVMEQKLRKDAFPYPTYRQKIV
jgi:hypothetical protein